MLLSWYKVSYTICRIKRNARSILYMKNLIYGGLFIYYVRRILRKTNISYPLIQGVRNVSFLENFAHVLNEWPHEAFFSENIALNYFRYKQLHNGCFGQDTPLEWFLSSKNNFLLICWWVTGTYISKSATLVKILQHW